MITKNIQDIIESLEHGEVVGLPTETVYGLAANAFDENAIQKIFTLKNRPLSNPLILHSYSTDAIKKFIKVNSYELLEIAHQYWPGPLTILLEKNECIPDTITAGSKYVAFRIPNHPLILKVLQNVDFPIAAPSANPYQRISPTNAQQVYGYFGESIPFILDGGNCACGIESTIIGMQKDQIIIYRQGAVTYEQLKSKFKNVKLNEVNNNKIKTSGMSKKHYAPRTKMILVDSISSFIKENKDLKVGILSFKNMNGLEIAKNYYSRLSELDKAGYDIIIAEKFVNKGIGRALNDKITRAIKLKS